MARLSNVNHPGINDCLHNYLEETEIIKQATVTEMHAVNAERASFDTN